MRCFLETNQYMESVKRGKGEGGGGGKGGGGKQAHTNISRSFLVSESKIYVRLFEVAAKKN